MSVPTWLGNGTGAPTRPCVPGRLIYRSLDPLIEVVDDGASRALHFGTPARQSGMWLAKPERLRLPYTRAMMSMLLLLAQPPRRVLLLGLGGGSVAKFLLHAFSECHIDAVEHSPQVVQVAHDYFALPRTERCAVHVGDAESFVAQADTGIYDAVLVDLYDAAGAASCVGRTPFVRDCRRVLHPGGVLAINLWRGPGTGCRSTLAVLGHVYGARPLRVTTSQRGNLIALAPRDPAATAPIPGFDVASWTAPVDPTLDLPDYARQLRRQRQWWNRVLPTWP